MDCQTSQLSVQNHVTIDKMFMFTSENHVNTIYWRNVRHFCAIVSLCNISDLFESIPSPIPHSFTIVIFIHYKSRIAIVVDEDDLMWFKNSKKLPVLVDQFHGHLHSKTPSCRKVGENYLYPHNLKQNLW